MRLIILGAFSQLPVGQKINSTALIVNLTFPECNNVVSSYYKTIYYFKKFFIIVLNGDKIRLSLYVLLFERYAAQ